MIDLRLGHYADVMQDVECSTLICDCPYSSKTHDGHHGGVEQTAAKKGCYVRKSRDGSLDYAYDRAEIEYTGWTPADVDAFVDFWAPRTRGWMVSLTDDVLMPHWKAAMARHGRTTFQDVPAIISGMTVRLAGDGPSSWAIHCVMSRPKSLSKWGTLPGGYWGPSERQFITGGKPLWLMRALIRDYSKVGDLICDPTFGGGTTGRAAQIEGRRFVGSEQDATTFAKAKARLGKHFTPNMFPTSAATAEQVELF